MAARFLPPAAWQRPATDPNDRFVGDAIAKGASGGFGLFGIPFDGAVLGRRGARSGPPAIRAALYNLKPTVGGAELPLRLRDFGDLDVPADDVPAAHALAEEAARAIRAAGFVPVALGGDHSLTYPLVAAHRDIRPGVVNLDAHLDVRDVLGGRINSGTSFGRLLEDGIVDGPRLVEAGVRPFATSPAYFAKAAKHGVHVLTADEVREDPEGAATTAAHLAGGHDRPLYVSIDIDVLDQAHAPGVSAPTPGGLESQHLFRFLRGIGGRDVAGIDLVEVAPNFDPDGRTARVAAWALLELLVACHKSRGWW